MPDKTSARPPSTYSPVNTYQPRLDTKRCAAAVETRNGMWAHQCSYKATVLWPDAKGIERGWCSRHSKHVNP